MSETEIMGHQPISIVKPGFISTGLSITPRSDGYTLVMHAGKESLALFVTKEEARIVSMALLPEKTAKGTCP